MTAATLSPATVFGRRLSVGPDYDDDTNVRLILASNASLTVRLAEQAASIIRGFEFEYCEACGEDLDKHAIAPDLLGNAHSYCLSCPECPNLSANLRDAFAHPYTCKGHPLTNTHRYLCIFPREGMSP